jgi:DNA repair exonuclease SbcCD ATPase subunit
MRDITFQEVGMKNFGPYIDPMILTFKNNSLVLMRGPNGIGKTMALDAIPFTLYGETSKKAKGDDVVNNRIGKNCHSWLKFTINEDIYKVDRYHKYTKYGNTVILNKNGVDIKKGQREVLPEIERLVCPKKSFMNTLMFGQKIKDFFTDLLDSDKKEIFRKILNLDIYAVYYKKADELLKEVIETRDKTNTQIQIDSGILSEVKTQIALFIEAEKQFENDKVNKIKSLNQTLEECGRMTENWLKQWEEAKKEDHNMEAITTSLSSIMSKVDSISEKRESEINQIHAKSSQKEAELSNQALEIKTSLRASHQKDVDEANKSLRDCEQENKKIIDKLTKEKSEITSDISGWETTLYMTESQRSEFQSSIDLEESICPTCLQDMNDDCISHLQEQIDDLDKSISKNQTKVNDGNLKIDYLHKEMSTATEQMQESNAYYQKNTIDNKQVLDFQLKESDERLENALEKVKILLETETESIVKKSEEEMKQGQKEMKELLEKKQEVENNLKNIEEIETSISNIKTNKEWALKEMEETEESEYDKSQLNNQRNRKTQIEVSIQQSQLLLLDLNSKIEIYTFWKSAYSSSGIPSMLIDESIPFMNTQVSDYLEKMTNGRYIVSFDTLASTKSGEFRDKISVHVLDTQTGANSRVQLSGGQTRIIDIATILTLGDLQSNMQDVKFNILLFDEIFDALDDENIGYVSKVLSKMKFDKSIYVISHTHVDQLEADEVLVMH